MGIEKELKDLKAKITPLNTIKFLTGTLISLGTAAAVIGMFKVPLAGSKGVTKLLMKLGILALGCKIGDDAEKYFNAKFDECADALKMNQEAQENV